MTRRNHGPSIAAEILAALFRPIAAVCKLTYRALDSLFDLDRRAADRNLGKLIGYVYARMRSFSKDSAERHSANGVLLRARMYAHCQRTSIQDIADRCRGIHVLVLRLNQVFNLRQVFAQ
jgi:hypothetical protein